MNVIINIPVQIHQKFQVHYTAEMLTNPLKLLQMLDQFNKPPMAVECL